jgi:hypothetical protein
MHCMPLTDTIMGRYWRLSDRSQANTERLVPIVFFS